MILLTKLVFNYLIFINLIKIKKYQINIILLRIMSKKSTNIQLLPSELLVDIIKAIKFTPSSFTNKTLHMLIKDRTEWSKYATKLMNCSSIIYTFVGNTFLEFKVFIK